MSAYTPVGGRRRFRAMWIGAGLGAVILVAGMVGVLIGRGSTPVATPGPSAYTAVPHGPAQIVAGIPSGFTQDELGAVTAASAYVQTGRNIMGGRADAVAAQQMLSASATPALRRDLESYQPGSAAASMAAALAAKTRSYQPGVAVIDLWVCGATILDTGAASRGAASCMTATVSVTWENNDWKVSDIGWVAGPSLDEFGAVFTGDDIASLGGALTVYVG